MSWSSPPEAADQLAELRVQTGLKLPGCCVLLSAQAAISAVASFDGRLLAAVGQLGLTAFA